MKISPVEEYIMKEIHECGSIHFTLLDPENSYQKIDIIAQNLETIGTKAILIGGSTVSSASKIDKIIKKIKKKVKIPIILFPNNISGISRYADAILFMSLLNSFNPYFITGIQALGAPLIRQYKLCVIPLGYIIVGEKSTVSYMGQANPIPRSKPNLAVMYALASQYLGMRFVYLEAGSGSEKPIPVDMVRAVKEKIEIPLIVGGGIKNAEVARHLVEAGADIIVTGTVIEGEKPLEKIFEFINEIKKVKKIKK